MGAPRVSIIIPTRDRPDALAETLRTLARQTLRACDYELLVIDDGSTPPASLPTCASATALVRLDGVERSAARNAGARRAQGAILLFVDDDMSVEPQFVEQHLRAHVEWPDALVVGSIELPREATGTPFGRFRQALEATGRPCDRGPVTARNFCTAANMSIARQRFVSLGGFDEALTSGEDQDLALRHTTRGGQIVFVPEARAIHRDDALDLLSYCRRLERGTERIVAFCRRHPDWPDNVARDTVNGPPRWGREPALQSARKVVKALLASPPAIALLVWGARMLERAAPPGARLDRVYRLVIGSFILRGYRRGLQRA